MGTDDGFTGTGRNTQKRGVNGPKKICLPTWIIRRIGIGRYRIEDER